MAVVKAEPMNAKWHAQLLTAWIIAGLLHGCDGSLTVIGNIVPGDRHDPMPCEITLWRHTGPLWGPMRPTIIGSSIVNDGFRVHWTIGGPEADHWIELACPNHTLYRSPNFRAPSTTRERDFGDIVLVPVSQGGP